MLSNIFDYINNIIPNNDKKICIHCVVDINVATLSSNKPSQYNSKSISKNTIIKRRVKNC